MKRAYAAANRILGDIVKVTPCVTAPPTIPQTRAHAHAQAAFYVATCLDGARRRSSKVVGDLAQFMVANKLTEAQVADNAATLSFPQSVIEYLQGYLGIPEGGFPEPFRSNVLRGRKLPNGRDRFEGRPGAELPPLDFARVEAEMREKYGEHVRPVDVLSRVMYPAVYDDWMRFASQYGDVSVIPTRYFTTAMRVGEEISFELERGKTLFVRLKSVGAVDDSGHREVLFEMNGEARTVRIADLRSGVKVKARSKASKADPGQVGAPMPGVVVDVRVTVGAKVEKGAPLAVLSAMKMETVVAAPRPGVVKTVAVTAGENLEAGDLVVVLE